MTFSDAVYAVDGARITGQLFRQQLRAATRSRQGIILPTDLEVRELATPGSSVRIGDGDGVILGREILNQGSYFATNNGEEELPIAATGAGETRSDLIVARAEDPTFSGSPWGHDPATERIVWPRVIADVPPGTRTLQEVEPGQSGITLARVDMPESTATVTQDLITPLRQVLDPLKEYVQNTVPHTGADDDLTQFNTSYVPWPIDAGWTVRIPTWATRADILAGILMVHVDGGTSDGDIFGQVRLNLDGDPAVDSSFYNFNAGGGAGIVNGSPWMTATFNVADLQGQDVTLRTEAKVNGGTAGSFLRATPFVAVVYQVQFDQLAG